MFDLSEITCQSQMNQFHCSNSKNNIIYVALKRKKNLINNYFNFDNRKNFNVH